MTERTCKKCKHCDRWNSDATLWQCKSPKRLYCSKELGAYIADWYYCEDYRQDEKLCGITGDWFEPIPEKKSFLDRIGIFGYSLGRALK